MNVFKLIILAWLAFSALVTIATVGRTREPITPGVAVASVVTAGALAVLVVLS